MASEKFDKTVSRGTVINIQHDLGLGMYVCRNKPFLRPDNIKKRYDIAKDWIYASDDVWKRVIWSDESPFDKINIIKRQYVRRSPGKSLEM